MTEAERQEMAERVDAAIDREHSRVAEILATADARGVPFDRYLRAIETGEPAADFERATRPVPEAALDDETQARLAERVIRIFDLGAAHHREGLARHAIAARWTVEQFEAALVTTKPTRRPRHRPRL